MREEHFADLGHIRRNALGGTADADREALGVKRQWEAVRQRSPRWG